MEEEVRSVEGFGKIAVAVYLSKRIGSSGKIGEIHLVWVGKEGSSLGHSEFIDKIVTLKDFFRDIRIQYVSRIGLVFRKF